MCTVTIQDTRLLETTIEPNYPCKPTSITFNIHRKTMVLLLFQYVNDHIAQATSRKPVITPIKRFTYSVQVLAALNSSSTNIDLSCLSLVARSPKPILSSSLANRGGGAGRAAAEGGV